MCVVRFLPIISYTSLYRLITKKKKNVFIKINNENNYERNYEKRSHTLCKGGKTHVRGKIFTDNFLHFPVQIDNKKKKCIYQNK